MGTNQFETGCFVPTGNNTIPTGNNTILQELVLNVSCYLGGKNGCHLGVSPSVLDKQVLLEVSLMLSRCRDGWVPSTLAPEEAKKLVAPHAVPPTDWSGEPADDNISPHLLFVSERKAKNHDEHSTGDPYNDSADGPPGRNCRRGHEMIWHTHRGAEAVSQCSL